MIKALSETKTEAPKTPKPETPKPKTPKSKTPKTPKIPEPEPEPKIRVKTDKKKLKNLRKYFNELRHKFDKEEIGRYRKYFYVAKNKKYLSESELNKTNKNLNELEKSLIFKKFNNNNDIDSVDALENLKPKEQTKPIEDKSNNQSKAAVVFNDLISRRKIIMSGLYDSADYNNLNFEYVINTKM